jgi:hypothetical protein
MNTSLLHKAVLLVSGVTAVYIGGSIIASPGCVLRRLRHRSLPAMSVLLNELGLRAAAC